MSALQDFHRVAVFQEDRDKLPAYPKRSAKPVLCIMSLEDALTTHHPRDAHATLYVAEGCIEGGRQHRISKYHAHTYPDGPVTVSVLLADVDNPEHGSWTPESKLATKAFLERTVTTCGWYFSRNGYRLVQPLAAPVPFAEAEDYIQAWWAELRALGIPPDKTCKAWTQPYRLPYVLRDGRRTEEEADLDLSRMRPITPTPWHGPTSRAKKLRGPPRPFPSDFAWQSTTTRDIAKIAEAMRRAGAADRGMRHHLFLRLAGELVLRGAPYAEIPGICADVAQRLGTDARAAFTRARSTIERWSTGAVDIAGLRESPLVQEAVRELTATGDEARVYAQRQHEVERVDPAAVAAEMRAEMREQPRTATWTGVALFVVPPGSGKTEAALANAVDRREGLQRRVPDGETKQGTKTTLLVPTHQLAQELQRRTEGKAKGSTLRMFSPIAGGCEMKEQIENFISAGLSMHRDACLHCPNHEACDAESGLEGEEKAAITIATHARTESVVAKLGETELLVVDEPESLLLVERLAPEDFRLLDEHAEHFDWKYRKRIRPAIHALRDWWEGAVPCVDVRDVYPDRQHQTPHLAEGVGRRLMRSRTMPPEVARTIKLLNVAHAFFKGDHPLELRRELHREENGDLVLRYPNPRMMAILMRSAGRTHLLDATSIDIEAYERVCGYAPPVVAGASSDGAPIARTLLFTKGCTRTGWQLTSPYFDWTAIAKALRSAIDWTLEVPTKSIGIITYMAVEEALQPGGRLHSELARLGDTRVLTGHFGALRGLNKWEEAGCDALVTLGDPWQPPGDVAAFCRIFDLKEQTPGERAELLCRAELEQAHGRLRTIHRDRPGRQLHVGAVLPSGHGWPSAEVRHMAATPKAKRSDDYDVEVLRGQLDDLGTPAQVARLLGLSRQLVTKGLSRVRPFSAETLARIAELHERLGRVA